jgi:beta-lactamase regulating signal transducer with metallopeptidase domain
MSFESLLASPEIQALGWSLVHFLWQGALLAAILAVVNASIAKFVGKQSAASLHYIASCIAMLLMPVALIATWMQMYPPRTPSLSRSPSDPVAAVSGVVSAVDSVTSSATATTDGGPGLPGWMVCFWLLGVLGLSAHAGVGWVRAQRLRRQAAGLLDSLWTEELIGLQQKLGITRAVRLCTSAVTKTPMVIGWIRPFILLPATAITGLSETQLRAVLAHELAHVRRYDYLINLLQTAVETALFYHPAVWWVGRQIRTEREHCCDDIAIGICGNAVEYVHALTQLEELRSPRLQSAVAANGGELLTRVRRLLNQQQTDHRFPRSFGAVAATLLIAGLIAPPLFRSPSSATPLPAMVETGQSQAPPPAMAPTSVDEPSTVVQVEQETRRSGLLTQDTEREYRRVLGEYSRAIADAQRNFSANLIGDPPRSGLSAESTQMLIKLYDGTQDVELKSHILNYLGNSASKEASDKLLSVAQSENNPELRNQAIYALGGKAGTFDTLVGLYDTTRNIDAKRQILDTLAASDSQQAADKLLSIARSDPVPEMRHHAIDYLATKPNVFDTLVSLYDGTSEKEIKRHLLDYIGSLKDPRVLPKLFAIAQSDPDIELRRAAVDYIASR